MKLVGVLEIFKSSVRDCGLRKRQKLEFIKRRKMFQVSIGDSTAVEKHTVNSCKEINPQQTLQPSWS